jgi:hypothetical protein
MPYPNEHACRIKQPKEGADFRRTNGAREHSGKKYDVIYQRVGEAMTEQAYRYPKGSWSAGEARTHCTSHNGSFESAKDTAFKMLKADDEKQIVYGVIFEPDTIDSDDEFVGKDDIEDAAHNYMIKMRRNSGECHQKLSHEINIDDKSDVVESYVAPVDFEWNGELIKEGTWIVGMKIHDKDLWKECKDSITGFSAGGFASEVKS